MLPVAVLVCLEMLVLPLLPVRIVVRVAIVVPPFIARMGKALVRRGLLANNGSARIWVEPSRTSYVVRSRSYVRRPTSHVPRPTSYVNPAKSGATGLLRNVCMRGRIAAAIYCWQRQDRTTARLHDLPIHRQGVGSKALGVLAALEADASCRHLPTGSARGVDTKGLGARGGLLVNDHVGVFSPVAAYIVTARTWDNRKPTIYPLGCSPTRSALA
jgi:hypothetical protein